MSNWFGQRQKQSVVILLLALLGIIYMSWDRDSRTPESKVRKAIEELVEAAESKDLGPFKKHLSEKVSDESGRNKQELLNTLRVIFLRHPRIHLNLLKLDVDSNTNPDVITADLTLFMSESMIPSDRGNFFLTFRREDETWRVWEVEWDGGYGY